MIVYVLVLNTLHEGQENVCASTDIKDIHRYIENNPTHRLQKLQSYYIETYENGKEMATEFIKD